MREVTVSPRRRASFLAALWLLFVVAPSLHAAILNITGGETGDGTEVLASGAGFSLATTFVKTGTYSYRTNNSTAAGTAYFGIQNATGALLGNADMYCRAYLYIATAPSGGNREPIYQSYTTGGALKYEVDLAGDLQLDAYDNTGTTLIASGTTTLSTATWYRVEFRSGQGTSANYELRINGVSEYSGTANLVNTAHGSARFGKGVNRTTQTIDYYWDDVACDDAAYPADGGIKVMKPDGDGGLLAWTAGPGADNYTEVDDLPNDGDTTRITATATNDRQTVTLESTTSAGITASSINYVKAVGICMRDNGVNNGTFRLFYRISGTNYDQASNSTSGTSYAAGGYLRNTDPSDAAAWTTPDLDNLEIGPLDNHASFRTRCTAVYAMVDYVAGGGGGGGTRPPSGSLLRGIN